MQLGCALGSVVGCGSVGGNVGKSGGGVGRFEGMNVGSGEGCMDGELDRAKVPCAVGRGDGCKVEGNCVGSVEGNWEGIEVGEGDG